MLRKILLPLAALCLASPAFAQSQGMAVQGVGVNRATLNGATTIAAGNTFQSVLASNVGTSTIRQALTIQNNNATDNCWIYIGPTASATTGKSILLLAGGSYTRYWPYVPSDNIAATCANTNDTLYVDTQ